MSDASNDKIMGFIPREKYVQITYWLMLASVVGTIFTTILMLVGMYLPLSHLFSLAGLCALILGLLGFFVFKDRFSAHDQSHLIYIAVLFGVFFVAGIILGAVFLSFGVLMFLLALVLNFAYLVLAWTGYNSWSHGRTVTKDNIQSEVQLAMKRA